MVSEADDDEAPKNEESQETTTVPLEGPQGENVETGGAGDNENVQHETGKKESQTSASERENASEGEDADKTEKTGESATDTTAEETEDRSEDEEDEGGLEQLLQDENVEEEMKQPTKIESAHKEDAVKDYGEVSELLPEYILTYLDEIADQQLLDLIDNLQAEIRHHQLENFVFENFLENNDPACLQGFQQLVEQSLPTARKDCYKQLFADITKEHMEMRTSRASSVKQVVLLDEKGPRINLNQKTDLVLREIEEAQSHFTKFLKKSQRQKYTLVAELEEIGIRKAEIMEARNVFEQTVVIDGVDPLTQRIPAEKFIRYMDEWFKHAQSIVEKMRLRVSTYKQQYIKVSNLLTQKQELGETLHGVDFEQLIIENKNFLEKIEQKNTHLFELKKMNGLANLILSNHKQYLQRQMEEVKLLKEAILSKERKINELGEETGVAEQEMEEARNRYNYIKDLTESYRVPEVMTYIKKKAELYELKKNLKIWSRRKHVQDIALRSCIREMKNLTGTGPSKSWFELPKDISSESFIFNYKVDEVSRQQNEGK